MSEINLAYFPARLKNLRLKHSMTQAQMAEALGVAAASISYYEKGQRFPDLRVMDTLYQKFDVSFEYMLGYTELPLPNAVEGLDLELLNLSTASYEAIKKHFAPSHIDSATLNILLESPDFHTYVHLLACKPFLALQEKNHPEPSDSNERLLKKMLSELTNTDYEKSKRALEEALEDQIMEKGVAHPAFKHQTNITPNQLDDCYELLYKARIYKQENRPFPAEDQMRLNKHLKWLRKWGDNFEDEA